MRVHSRSSGGTTLGETVLAVLGWTVAGAMAGTALGGVFGTVFGVIGAVLARDAGLILLAAGYCLACGAAAGAIIGGFGRSMDPAGTADLLSSRESDALDALQHGRERPRALVNPLIARWRFLERAGKVANYNRDPSLN
jgi:hypothetical protein